MSEIRTATEIIRRQGELETEADRAMRRHLRQMVERTLKIMRERGMLPPELPAA